MESPMKHLFTYAVLFFSSVAVQSQVSIINPNHLNIPPGRPDAIHHAALRVVAEAFQLDDASELAIPLTLVLGEQDERYVEDEDQKIDAIYLTSWNEKKFAISVMRLALGHLVDRDCRNQLVGEILSRSETIAPVSVTSPKQR
jgi:hypothetical protein